MAAKHRFRARSSTADARSSRGSLPRGRAAIIATAMTIALLGFGASPTLANVGGVYFDANSNAAAGNPAHLFNATFTGAFNVGLGETVMPNLTSAVSNTAIGHLALDSATSGSANLAAGSAALAGNTTGVDNVAVGIGALVGNTTGNSNIGLGEDAGENLTTGSNNVDIANAGKAGESKAIRIGTDGTQRKAFLAGVSGVSLSGSAQPVLIKSNGQLGTATAASAKASAAKPLTAAVGRRLLATVKRQQRQIERQGKEIRALRSQNG
jgi:hypothetical protein